MTWRKNAVNGRPRDGPIETALGGYGGWRQRFIALLEELRDVAELAGVLQKVRTARQAPEVSRSQALGSVLGFYGCDRRRREVGVRRRGRSRLGRDGLPPELPPRRPRWVRRCRSNVDRGAFFFHSPSARYRATNLPHLPNFKPAASKGRPSAGGQILLRSLSHNHPPANPNPQTGPPPLTTYRLSHPRFTFGSGRIVRPPNTVERLPFRVRREPRLGRCDRPLHELPMDPEPP